MMAPRVLALLVLLAAGVRAEVRLECPEAPIAGAGIVTGEVLVDTGDRTLGAYTFIATFDPSLLRLDSVVGGQTAEFASVPFTNPEEYRGGLARILAFNSASLVSPTGVSSVARLRWSVVGSPGSSATVDLEIRTLADTDGQPIPAQALGCTVTIASEPATATATVPAATPSPSATSVASPMDSPTAPASPTPSATQTPAPCIGDCDADGLVTIAEVLHAVSISLGLEPLEGCRAGDANGDGTLSVDEILRAVHGALNECAPAATPTATPPAGTCDGDCDGDGEVTVAEVLQAVSITLGLASPAECPAADRDRNGDLSVDEVLGAVHGVLDECAPAALPTATPMNLPTATATRTSPPYSPTPPLTSTQTASATATSSATATPRPNHAPILGAEGVYESFPGFEIRRAVIASDEDGDTVRCRADALPPGASFDEEKSLLSWTPDIGQVGPAFIPVTCTDSASTPLSASGTLAFRISPESGCVEPACDPAIGCTATLRPLEESCCALVGAPRVGNPLVDCPASRSLVLGRNNNGFGRIQHCDRLRVINFQQAGASVRFNLRTRCLDASEPVTVHARLTTADRLLFEESTAVRLVPGPSGSSERLGMLFPVLGPGPFFEFEAAEAELQVSVTDALGVTTSSALRLLLTFDPLDDLPETPDESQP